MMKSSGYLTLPRKAFIFGMLGLFAVQSFAQSPADFTSDYRAFASQFPWEKAYLHTDKPHYLFNDTVWIKAYALKDKQGGQVEGSPSVPLYVDLFHNGTGRQVTQIIIKLEDGKGRGDIALPPNLEGGRYTLRAFTNWMRNFGQEAFYQQDIWIGDLGDFPTPAVVDAPSFQLGFFPEGGELVAGLTSKVAFKATDASGKGTDLLGMLLNAQNDTLLHFSAEHLGMGGFEFKPEPGQRYKALARTAHSDWQEFPFTQAAEKGYVMQVTHSLDGEDLEVVVRGSDMGSQNPLRLVGFRKGQVVLEKEIETGEKGLLLSKDDFFPGLVQLTLLDAAGAPKAERLVYFHPFAGGKADFKTDKEDYDIQETVRMEITVRDEFGDPVEGEFSLSVTDAQQVFQDHRMDIFSYLELSSELKGEIEQPFYYFDDQNEEAEKHLDNLLLTQGWRRFVPMTSARNQPTPQFEVEKGLNISGQVTRRQKQVDEPELLTMLINTGREMPIVIEGSTDEMGRFSFSDLDFRDSVGVFIQAHTEKQKKSGEIRQLMRSEVNIDSTKAPEFFPSQWNPWSGLVVYRDYEDYLVEVKETRDIAERFRLNQEIELGEVTVRGRRSDQVKDKRALQYGNNPDFSMEVTQDYYVYSNVFHILRGRAPGVNVVGDVFNYTSPPSLIIRGPSTLGNASGGGASILVDGNPVNYSTAMAILVVDIERIDVLRSRAKTAVFGGAGAGGVVNILTKSGNPNKEITPKATIFKNATLQTNGYATVREFYTPSGVPDGPKTSFDYRSTIYWQPVVRTDAYGKAAVEFPLTEGRTTVDIDLQGLSMEGEPIRGRYQFDVQ